MSPLGDSHVNSMP